MTQAAHTILGSKIQAILKWYPGLVVEKQDEDIQESGVNAYLMHPQGDFEIVIDSDGQASSVFFHKNHQLLDHLPVCIGSAKAEVQATYGAPSKSGQQFNDSLLGPQGAWDRYTLDIYALHFHYLFDGEVVEKITYMTLDTAERLG